MIRVLLADDHPVVRQGLRNFLDLQEDIEVVGEASDGAQAVAIATDQRPDVVLLDLVMPGMDGIEALRRIRELSPEVAVIVLTSFIDEDKAIPAVRAGASGYLLKDVGPAELADAIRAIYRGDAVLHPSIAKRLIREVADPVTPLTARELEVLRAIARGLTNRQIAREFGVAEKTVKTHVSAVLRKLRLVDRTQAAIYAVREGIAPKS